MVKHARLILIPALLALSACGTLDALMAPPAPPPAGPDGQVPPVVVVDPTPLDPVDRGDVVIAEAKETADFFGFGEVAGGVAVIAAGAWALYKKVRKTNNGPTQGGDVQTP